MTDMTQNKASIPTDDKNKNHEHDEMLQKRIKEKWPKLLNEDVGLYNSFSDKFFMRLKNLYHVEKEDAEKQILELKKMIAA